jgi:pyruvate formate lyase activating enzyme
MGIQKTGLIAEIQHYSLQDGPGIRTTVFLKGCPLRCLWCHNPEMVNPSKEVWYTTQLCTNCGRCIAVCPARAIKGYQDDRVIDRNACIANTGCRKCVESCPNNAMAVVGTEMTVEAVAKDVQKDAIFYMRSGGGTCISGGEPSLQADFAADFLKECQDHALRTSIETCSYAHWDTLSKVAQYADTILADIKHMDPVKHKEGTGVSNELILKNIAELAKMANKMGKMMRIRLPLIPGYNDSEDNLRKTAEFMVANHLKYIDLLAYHSFAENKYKKLGKKFTTTGVKEPSTEDMTKHKTLFETYGLEVNIGGVDIKS